MPKPCPVCHGTGQVEDAYTLQLADPRYLDDEAPTLKLPPVRDSIGARRQPPTLRELPPGSAELLHLIADALKADEDGPTL